MQTTAISQFGVFAPAGCFSHQALRMDQASFPGSQAGPKVSSRASSGACYVDCQYLLEYTPFLSSESSKSYCLSLLFVVNRHTILIRSMGVTHSRSRNDYCYKAPFAFNPVLYETHAFIASQVLFCHFRMAERHFRSLRAIQYDAFMD
jgi:hypothetical protein